MSVRYLRYGGSLDRVNEYSRCYVLLIVIYLVPLLQMLHSIGRSCHPWTYEISMGVKDSRNIHLYISWLVLFHD